MPTISGGKVIEGATPIPFQKAGALASGDFNGSADVGALAVDQTNGKLYINTGTRAATVWTVVGAQV
jgi:hypothetical protein